MAKETLSLPPSRMAATPPATPPPKQVKTPRQRFVALGNRRLTNAVRSLVIAARMGNPKQYETTQGERDRALAAVKDAYDGFVRAFNRWSDTQSNGVSFVDPPA
jgi:hypothetical protein